MTEQQKDTRSLLRRVLSSLYWQVRWRVEGYGHALHAKVKRVEDARRIEECPLFDVEWYLTMHGDVASGKIAPAMHYLLYGAAEGRDPGPKFSTIAYIARYPDVTNSRLNPLIHYLDIGEKEGRNTLPRDPHESGYRVVCICGEPDSPGIGYRVEDLVTAIRAVGSNASWMTIERAAVHPEGLTAANILVLWRVAWDDVVEKIVKFVRIGGALVLFDTDDLTIEPALANRAIIDGIRTQGMDEAEVETYFERTLKTFERADWTSCPTEELAAAMRMRGKPTFVIPNGYNETAWRRSRLAVRRRHAEKEDGLVRIGYAAGTPTHQRDFGQAVEAVASVLKETPNCRLVLFKGRLDSAEFPALRGLENQIEWREFVPHQDLPDELARFDINIAPLEVGNPFCEAKSELKFVEAALVDVCTVASPTGPFRRAIRDGETGFLCTDTTSWTSTLRSLVHEPDLRDRIGHAAGREILWKYGPHRRVELAASMLDQMLKDVRSAARSFAVEAAQPGDTVIGVPGSEIVFESDALRSADVTVVVPLYNYGRFVSEALDSVAAQTLTNLDLIVVDDASTDDSLSLAESWLRGHASRFNRALLLRNTANAGLGATRNSAFDAAETPFVLPLDADNRLMPEACETLLAAMQSGFAAYAYPLIRQFEAGDDVMGKAEYAPQALVGGNVIDAMAMIRKDCWVAVGGYASMRPQGWEDFDFWCRLAECGLWGTRVPKILAEYRVHHASMQALDTNVTRNQEELVNMMQRRHPWLSLVHGFKNVRSRSASDADSISRAAR